MCNLRPQIVFAAFIEELPRPTGHLRLCQEGCGAAEETRTPDPIITNDVLYQLSYSGLVAGLIASSTATV